MIEDRTVTVATCDACGHMDYCDDEGGFLGSDGYTLAIIEHKDESHHKAYACRETHIGKAARAVLEGWRATPNGGDWSDEIGRETPLRDAPPLPQAEDAPAVTS